MKNNTIIKLKEITEKVGIFDNALLAQITEILTKE